MYHTLSCGPLIPCPKYEKLYQARYLNEGSLLSIKAREAKNLDSCFCPKVYIAKNQLRFKVQNYKGAGIKYRLQL